MQQLSYKHGTDGKLTTYLEAYSAGSLSYASVFGTSVQNDRVVIQRLIQVKEVLSREPSRFSPTKEAWNQDPSASSGNGQPKTSEKRNPIASDNGKPKTSTTSASSVEPPLKLAPSSTSEPQPGSATSGIVSLHPWLHTIAHTCPACLFCSHIQKVFRRCLNSHQHYRLAWLLTTQTMGHPSFLYPDPIIVRQKST